MAPVRATEGPVTRTGPLLIAQNPFNCTRFSYGFNCRGSSGPLRKAHFIGLGWTKRIILTCQLRQQHLHTTSATRQDSQSEPRLQGCVGRLARLQDKAETVDVTNSINSIKKQSKETYERSSEKKADPSRARWHCIGGKMDLFSVLR